MFCFWYNDKREGSMCNIFKVVIRGDFGCKGLIYARFWLGVGII